MRITVEKLTRTAGVDVDLRFDPADPADALRALDRAVDEVRDTLLAIQKEDPKPAAPSTEDVARTALAAVSRIKAGALKDAAEWFASKGQGSLFFGPTTYTPAQVAAILKARALDEGPQS